MKTILVTLFLFSSTLILVILLDLKMNFTLSDIFWKELKPFKIYKTTEITILSIMGVYFVVKSLVGFLKKKRNKQNSQENANENSPS